MLTSCWGAGRGHSSCGVTGSGEGAGRLACGLVTENGNPGGSGAAPFLTEPELPLRALSVSRVD